MGQGASRQAAKHAQRAAKNGGPKTSSAAPRPPPLGRAEADEPEVIEDATRALQQRQQKEQNELLKGVSQQQQQSQSQRQPARPDPNSGFFRGGAPVEDPRDVAQEKFLVHQSGGKKEMEEISPDLLQFLKDAGPLQKKVNKELTSSRVLKDLEKGEESERLHRFQAAQRQRTDMRLVESIEGHTTTRTTNFFSSVEEEDPNDFGLSDLEIYDLLKRKSREGRDRAVASFYKDKTEHFSGPEWTEEDQQNHQKLLQDTAQVLELPIVIKDRDANYIGAWPEEVEEKEFGREKLDIVDESRVKLVLADLVDLQRKQIRKLR